MLSSSLQLLLFLNLHLLIRETTNQIKSHKIKVVAINGENSNALEKVLMEIA